MTKFARECRDFVTILGRQRIGRVGFLLVLILAGCRQTEANPTSLPRSVPTPAVFEGVIVAMGNSLTEGIGVAEAETYPAQLARKLQADGYNFQVINAGVSGETSSGALARLAWILDLEPDIVILETGGNDGLRAIDPAVTKANINQLVTGFQAQGIIVVLAGMQMTENLGQDYVNEFEAIYPEISQQHDLIHIPFFLEGVAAEASLNQPDAIHPNPAGYGVVVNTIYPYVLEAIEQFRQQSSA